MNVRVIWTSIYTEHVNGFSREKSYIPQPCLRNREVWFFLEEQIILHCLHIYVIIMQLNHSYILNLLWKLEWFWSILIKKKLILIQIPINVKNNFAFAASYWIWLSSYVTNHYRFLMKLLYSFIWQTFPVYCVLLWKIWTKLGFCF